VDREAVVEVAAAALEQVRARRLAVELPRRTVRLPQVRVVVDVVVADAVVPVAAALLPNQLHDWQTEP
jgi:hypothetical protein